MGSVVQFGINGLPFGEEGGFCCSVIGEYLNLVPKPAPTSNFSAPNAFANKLRKFIFFVQSLMFYE
ncbi:MAG: hypothetical protein ACOCXU_00615 [Coleofasciculus sp.]